MRQNLFSTPIRRTTNPFDSDSDSEVPSRPSGAQSAPMQFTNQFVQELENHSLCKAEEASSKVNDCVRVAEAMREDATQILLTLHRQGEQITHTHRVAADMEQDLTMCEQLLGSLGGLFSKTWMPKRNQHIKGPVSQNSLFKITSNQVEQRQKLGIASTPQQSPSSVHSAPTSAMDKIKFEKSRQDGAFADLSNILGDLKGMAVDMGTEIDRQNKSLDTFSDDIDELSFRVKGANQQGCRLLWRRVGIEMWNHCADAVGAVSFD